MVWLSYSTTGNFFFPLFLMRLLPSFDVVKKLPFAHIKFAAVTFFFFRWTAQACICRCMCCREDTHFQRLVSVCLCCPCYVLLFIQTGSALVMASFLMTDLWLFARKLAGGLLWRRARVCVRAWRRETCFLKGTHSHPNNTGVDLENSAAGLLFIYSALLLVYFLTISSLFISVCWPPCCPL